MLLDHEQKYGLINYTKEIRKYDRIYEMILN